MPHPNANAHMQMSDAGREALVRAEHVRYAYYNDQGHNCTYGAGTLVHYGPCTAAELASPVPQAAIIGSLHHGVEEAERIVRTAVPGHALSQAQFDAAVSFAYNVGPRARRALAPANAGDLAAVGRNMQQYVMVCRHDRSGRTIPGSCHRSNGLIARRAREAAPFARPVP